MRQRISNKTLLIAGVAALVLVAGGVYLAIGRPDASGWPGNSSITQTRSRDTIGQRRTRKATRLAIVLAPGSRRPPHATSRLTASKRRLTKRDTKYQIIFNVSDC